MRSTYSLTVISLGGGVQSSVMALMASGGAFGQLPDCAIFAATHWESPTIYTHLDWLSRNLSFPLSRIHRRRASGQCPEAARGCSCESGIMVLKQQSRPQNKEHPIDATTQPSRSHPNRV